jgi:tRNA(Ile)-lysidine synthase
MERIEQKFLKFIDEQSLIIRNEKILVGFSGGPDSIFLLHLLTKFKKKLQIEVCALHVNHLLRGNEAADDEKFCKNYCERNKIKFDSVRKRVKSFSERNRISLEEAGRILRYKEFESLVRKKRLDKIATAHNSNDNTETVLLNLIKGTGLDGISGIPVKRKNIIRPILCFTKDEILSYLSQKKINYRIDKSNFDSNFERNYLRNKIIPLIKERLNPSLETSIFNSSENFKKINEYIRTNEAEIFKNTNRDSSGIINVQIAELESVDKTIQGLLLKNLLERELKTQIFSNDLKKIFSLVKTQVGKRIELSGGIIVFRERDYLKIVPVPEVYLDSNTIIFIGETKSTYAGQLSIKKCDSNTVVYSNNKNKEYISADTIAKQFSVRKWKPGDFFYPLGMKGSKKISDYLNENKVESSSKKNHLIMLNKNRIVWVIGMRLDERFKVTPLTKKILELCLE